LSPPPLAHFLRHSKVNLTSSAPTFSAYCKGDLLSYSSVYYSLQSSIMSFSSLVQDLSFRDANDDRRTARVTSSASTADDRRSHVSRAMSYASTAATSVSISGDISSQLHGGYSHPLARSWQAERQLTKVSYSQWKRPAIADTG
jgi:hypothetical protein